MTLQKLTWRRPALIGGVLGLLVVSQTMQRDEFRQLGPRLWLALTQALLPVPAPAADHPMIQARSTNSPAPPLAEDVAQLPVDCPVGTQPVFRHGQGIDHCMPLPGIHSDLRAIFPLFAKQVGIREDGDVLVFTTQDLPDHTSPYFPDGDARQSAPHPGMVVNPNRIRAQNYTLRIPKYPAFAARVSDTPMDAIGIARNGVVLFNQYAARRRPLRDELPTFDQYNGHPAPFGNYHYHLEPLHLTRDNPAALVGLMLDGFPLYGPRDADGSTPTLDDYNGHFHATAEFPQGIYHYHVTAGVPYFSGGFRGTPGTVSND